MHPAARVLAATDRCPDRRTLARTLVRRLADDDSPVREAKIYRLIDEGRCSRALAARIAATLPDAVRRRFLVELAAGHRAASAGLGNALGLSSDQQADFRPHLWILHERSRPKTLFVVALTGLERWKRIELPAHADRCSRAQRRRIRRSAVREHFREDGQRDGLFGRAIGYVYRPSPEHSYRMTTDGRLDSLDLGPFTEPQTRYSVHVK